MRAPPLVDLGASFFAAVYDRLARGGQRVVEFTAGIVIRNLELLARQGDTQRWTGPGRPPFIYWEPDPVTMSSGHLNPHGSPMPREPVVQNRDG